jgi:hypothetical protein
MQAESAVPPDGGNQEPMTYTPHQDTAAAAVPPDPAGIVWEASEYVHHDKNMQWYVALGVVALLVAGAAAWLGYWTFAVLVVAMATALGFFAARPPRTISYKLSDRGLQIGEKLYAFTDFRAFGVLPEDGVYSIMLIPSARFLPPVPIYINNADGEKIVDILGTHLPMQEFNPNPLDTFMRMLRF